MGQKDFRADQPNELTGVLCWPLAGTEKVMYSRQLSMELRPNSRADFTQKLVEGTPRVKTYEVANSTFRNISATLRAA